MSSVFAVGCEYAEHSVFTQMDEQVPGEDPQSGCDSRRVAISRGSRVDNCALSVDSSARGDSSLALESSDSS